ncbi:hypothetical protein QWA68_016826 [Fusarium oxysporum]|nr:hypothetical protein QWA68_016826 [Fusarium oxysporum]
MKNLETRKTRKTTTVMFWKP